MTRSLRSSSRLARPAALATAISLFAGVAAIRSTPPSTPLPSAIRSLLADSVHAMAFFAGTWKCTGGTPAGRVMNSTVSYSSVLGGKWTDVKHVDSPPSQYEMESLWPSIGVAGTPIATVLYDNFGGARRFQSRAWSADSVVWVRDSTETGAHPEQFTYRRTSDSTYWFAWHVKRSPTTPLTLGDSLTCTRLKS